MNIPQRCRRKFHNGDFILYARGLMHSVGGGVAEAEDERRGGRGMATQPGIQVELTLGTPGASPAIAILVIGEGRTRW